MKNQVKVWQCFVVNQFDGKTSIRNVGGTFKGTEGQAKAWTNLMYDTNNNVKYKEAEIMDLSRLQFEPIKASGLTAMFDQFGNHICFISNQDGEYCIVDEDTSESIKTDKDQLMELGNFKHAIK